MTSIQELYENPGVAQGQREYFWNNVHAIRVDPTQSVSTSFKYLCLLYDTGGISYGRSIRSLLLERALGLWEAGVVARAGRIVAVLVAMYHNHEYIEKHSWYDFRLNFGLYGSSLEERVHLAVLAYGLGVQNNIPDISRYAEEDFLSL